MPLLSSLLLLSFPVWGTAIAVGLIVLFHSEFANAVIVIVGIALIGLSGAPIFASPNMGSAQKAFLLVLYFLASAVAVFVVGLSLLCLHKCS